MANEFAQRQREICRISGLLTLIMKLSIIFLAIYEVIQWQYDFVGNTMKLKMKSAASVYYAQRRMNHA